MRLVFNDLQLFKTQQDDACQTYIDAMTGNGEYPVDDFFKDGVDKNKETLRLLQVVYDHLNNYEWDWTDEKANPIEVALAAVRSAPERCGLVEQWLSFNRWILRRRDELMASRAGLVDIIDFQYRLTYGPYSYICFQPELSKQWVLAKMRFLSALAMDDPPDVPREKGMEMLGKIATNHCLSCGHPDVRLSVSQEDLLDPSVEKLRDKDLVFLEGPEVPKGLLWCGCWGHTFKDWARWAPFQHLKPTGTSLRDCLVACDKCGHRTPFAWMGFDRNNGLVCTACLGDARRWEDDIREFNERQNVK
jgi:hypothetical protein